VQEILTAFYQKRFLTVKQTESSDDFIVIFVFDDERHSLTSNSPDKSYRVTVRRIALAYRSAVFFDIRSQNIKPVILVWNYFFVDSSARAVIFDIRASFGNFKSDMFSSPFAGYRLAHSGFRFRRWLVRFVALAGRINRVVRANRKKSDAKNNQYTSQSFTRIIHIYFVVRNKGQVSYFDTCPFGLQTINELLTST